MQESIVKLETNNFTTIQHWVNTKHQATLSQGAFYSGKSVRDFGFQKSADFKWIFSGFPRTKIRRIFTIFPPTFEHFHIFVQILTFS